jgi:hypothetical protein
MTNLDLACKAFGWAGGTMVQVALELGLRSNKASSLVLMPRPDFALLIQEWSRKAR